MRSVQHVAVLEVCKNLESTGCRVTILPVDEHGLVEVARLTAAIDPATTVIVSIMHANNETGTVQVHTSLCQSNTALLRVACPAMSFDIRAPCVLIGGASGHCA